ncbi:MAG: putative methyltransferase [Oceanicoccus sp.]|jgi:predicted methyltransferase
MKVLDLFSGGGYYSELLSYVWAATAQSHSTTVSHGMTSLKKHLRLAYRTIA